VSLIRHWETHPWCQQPRQTIDWSPKIKQWNAKPKFQNDCIN